MEIVYLDRESYRRKHDSETVESLKRRYGSFYLIPEGGSNALAVRGAREIVGEIDLDFDCIVTAVGTGGTLAGLIVGLGEGNRGAEAVGVAVLKGASFLKDDVAHLLSDVGPSSVRWRIELDYHFGGFARVRPELVEFMSEFEDKHGIVLDPIYTGKMAYGLLDLVEAGRFPPGTRIVALHTGGVPRTHWAGLVPEKD
jgi:1-aminocyclopropane-1-carboxylate deaminase